MPAKKPAKNDEDLDPALEDLEEVDIDPSALPLEEEVEDEEVAKAIAETPEEEALDPLAHPAAKDEDEEDDTPKPEVIEDGLDEVDGIEALKRAEKELHDMEFGTGGDAEEPEEDM